MSQAAMIVLTIPESSPSLNRMLGGHWSRAYRMRSRWHWLVRAARIEAKIFSRPEYPKARITFERTGARLLDGDNALAGSKWLTDGLVMEGLIAGDTLEHIGTPIIRQFVDRKIRRTVIRIEPL